MACFSPRRVATDEDGQLDWAVTVTSDLVDQVVLVPCRKCAGCLAASAQEWAIRCYHELETSWTKWRDPDSGVTAEVPNAAFLTLTYSDEFLPDPPLLTHRDVQLFVKALRRKLPGAKIRYFCAGEYGGNPAPGHPPRPHYHLIVYGHHFPDRYHVRTVEGQVLKGSYLLDEAWNRGTATLDDVNLATIRYVVGYVNKHSYQGGNFTGPLAECVNEETAELVVKPLAPEYRAMSRRPGLGHDWIHANLERVYPADEIHINGHTFSPPSFYDGVLRARDPDLHRLVVKARFDGRLQANLDWTPQRIAAAERIHYQKARKDSLA